MNDPRGSDAPPSERKAFLRILSSLAAADGLADIRELEHIHLAASDLGIGISERDLQAHDLQSLADSLQHGPLRERLLDELAQVANADGSVPEEELAVIKFFAKAWSLTPPAMGEVDWERVGPPRREDPEALIEDEPEEYDEDEEDEDFESEEDA